MCEKKVQAFIQDSALEGALIWDANDVYKLRVERRVLGGLIGAHPIQPRQNQQLGLPLILSPEEVSLLRNKGVLELRQYTVPSPSHDDVITYCNLKQNNADLQFKVHSDKMKSSGTFSHLTHTLTADPNLQLEHTIFPLAHWTYPHNTAEKQRLKVYVDLWERGYTLTSGLKYGADYLVYKGDPALVHSQYLALVLPWKQPIRTLPSLCRVGSKVVKSLLLCSVQDDDVIHYHTVNWNSD